MKKLQKRKRIKVLAFGIGLVLGFVAAYGFDTWLVWRDNKKWQ
jgi:prepilin signal peptidase PulO-like enzyme (type II secretory pathway)